MTGDVEVDDDDESSPTSMVSASRRAQGGGSAMDVLWQVSRDVVVATQIYSESAGRHPPTRFDKVWRLSKRARG